MFAEGLYLQLSHQHIDGLLKLFLVKLKLILDSKTSKYVKNSLQEYFRKTFPEKLLEIKGPKGEHV